MCGNRRAQRKVQSLIEIVPQSPARSDHRWINALLQLQSRECSSSTRWLMALHSIDCYASIQCWNTWLLQTWKRKTLSTTPGNFIFYAFSHHVLAKLSGDIDFSVFSVSLTLLKLFHISAPLFQSQQFDDLDTKIKMLKTESPKIST